MNFLCVYILSPTNMNNFLPKHLKLDVSAQTNTCPRSVVKIHSTWESDVTLTTSFESTVHSHLTTSLLIFKRCCPVQEPIVFKPVCEVPSERYPPLRKRWLITSLTELLPVSTLARSSSLFVQKTPTKQLWLRPYVVRSTNSLVVKRLLFRKSGGSHHLIEMNMSVVDRWEKSKEMVLMLNFCVVEDRWRRWNSFLILCLRRHESRWLRVQYMLNKEG